MTEDKHYPVTIPDIEAALVKARVDALEEAAQIADAHGMHRIADAIRKLKQEEPK